MGLTFWAKMNVDTVTHRVETVSDEMTKERQCDALHDDC